MHLQQPAIDVHGDIRARLGDVGVHADIQARPSLARSLPAGNGVEQVREPEQGIPIVHQPVEVDAAVALIVIAFRLVRPAARHLQRQALLAARALGADLQVGQDAGEGGDADAGADDEGVGEVVEALGGGAEGTVDGDADGGGVAIRSQGAQARRPVPVGFDVEVDGGADAGGDGEGVPLPGAEGGDLQEDVLAGLVLPEALAGDFGADFDGGEVEDFERGGKGEGGEEEAGGAFGEDEGGGEGEGVAEGRPVGDEEGDDGVHEEVG